MSIFANLFKKQADADAKVVGNVEDFVSLTRVYFQSVIAVNLGITNMLISHFVNYRLRLQIY